MRSERLLISMKDYIGDAVMTEPMLAAVEQLFARVELNVGSPVEEVLWRPGYPRHVVRTPRPRRLWDVVEHARVLRSRSYDVVILVNRSFRSALTARLAGIRSRVGHSTEGRRALLTRATPYDLNRFEALSHFDLAMLAGVESAPRSPRLEATEAEKRRGRVLVEGATVGLQPSARWQGKRLPFEVTVEVARELVASGEKVALLGASEEVETIDRLAVELNAGFVNLGGRTTVRETLGVLTSLRAMVGGDTGLMHLAAATGCPTVTVFGPTCASKWAHDYAPHRVVKAPNGDMTKLQAAEVMEAVREVLKSA